MSNYVSPGLDIDSRVFLEHRKIAARGSQQTLVFTSPHTYTGEHKPQKAHTSEIFFVCFDALRPVCFDALRPSQHFFSRVGKFFLSWLKQL